MFQLNFSRVNQHFNSGKSQICTFLEIVSTGDISIVRWIELKYIYGGAFIYFVYFTLTYAICEVC